MPSPGRTRLVVRGRWLYDGSEPARLPNPVVTVVGDRIEAVRTGAVREEGLPEDAHVIDLPEATLLPGLIDTHAHLNLPGDGSSFVEAGQRPEGVLVVQSLVNAGTALQAGVTTIRDCGARGRSSLDLQGAIHLGLAEGPRVVACGPPLTVTGGHCWFFGGETDGVDAIRRRVRALVRDGADYIKVMASGGGTPGTFSGLASYSQEELDAIVETAHALGRRVTAHCLCAEASRRAVRAGVDNIEHAGFQDGLRREQRFEPDVADAIAAAGPLVSATLAVTIRAIAALEALEARSPEQQGELDFRRYLLDRMLEQTAALHAAGVRFVTGSDAGWRYTGFDGVHDEIAGLLEAGIPAREVLAGATSRAAEALGIGHLTGRVRPGMAADLLAVAGDPLADPAVLHAPRLVIAGGRVHGGRSGRTPSSGPRFRC